MNRRAPIALILFACIAIFSVAREAARASDSPARDCIEAPDAVAPGTDHVAFRPASQNLEPHIAQACLLAEHAAGLVSRDEARDAEAEFDRALAIAPNDSIRSYVRARAVEAFSTNGGHHYDAEEWAQAILDYTLALRYGPDDETTYSLRATAHERNLEFSEAVADFSTAIRLSTAPQAYYMERGSAEEMNVDFKDAIADYSALLATGDDAQAFELRGRAYAALGNFDQGRPDLERSLALAPAEPATLLWLHIVHMRTGEDDANWLRSHAADADLTRWPGPAIEYFLGRKSADDMVQTGLTSPDTAKAYQRCDGWFYLGEEALARGDKAAAADLFRRTVAGCNALDYEWDTAQAELKRLEQE